MRVRSSAMFPPEPEARVRRVRSRPLPLLIAVVLLAAFWISSAGLAAWETAHDTRAGAAGVAGITFWTAVVALMLWRVWRGGPTATALASRLATLLGTVFCAGTVVLTVLLFTGPPGGSAARTALALLPALLGGAALLTAGLLLRRL